MGAIDKVIDEAVAGGKIAGTMILVARHGEVVYSRCAGFADRESGEPIAEDTIYRLASVSKPIVAAAVLALCDQGRMALDATVTDYLPWFTPKAPDGSTLAILIRHLLTHTSGVTYRPGLLRRSGVSGGLDDVSTSLQDNIRRLADVPLIFAPGTAWEYGMSIDVLGAVVEAVTGATLGDAVADLITGPLGMNDTAFRAVDPERLAVAYGDGPDQPVRMGNPHTVVDDNGADLIFWPERIFNPEAFQSGGAGMAGTAPDFLALLEAVRTGGGPIFSGNMAATAVTNQIGSIPRPDRPGQRFCYLGMVIEDSAAAETPQSVGTIGWGGVYGHSWFMDPVNGISAVKFTNTAVEGCTGVYTKNITEAIYADLT